VAAKVKANLNNFKIVQNKANLVTLEFQKRDRLSLKKLTQGWRKTSKTGQAAKSNLWTWGNVSGNFTAIVH
jgi:hypothetical protein